jgi:hypothetical protein
MAYILTIKSIVTSTTTTTRGTVFRKCPYPYTKKRTNSQSMAFW